MNYSPAMECMICADMLDECGSDYAATVLRDHAAHSEFTSDWAQPMRSIDDYLACLLRAIRERALTDAAAMAAAEGQDTIQVDHVAAAVAATFNSDVRPLVEDGWDLLIALERRLPR